MDAAVVVVDNWKMQSNEGGDGSARLLLMIMANLSTAQ